MSALDFGARGMAAQAQSAAKRMPALNTPALLALAQAQRRPVDLVCIGDSVQLFNGYGWDAALTRAFAENENFGIWASPLWPQNATGNQYNSQGYLMSGLSGATGVNTGADAAFADLRLPDASYLYTASGPIGGANGCVISQNGPISTNAAMRYHVYYGTFDSGAGSFRLGARMEDAPYSSLGVDGSVVSTNTGVKGEAKTSIDLPAGVRAHQVGFKLQRATASAGPTIFLAQRVQDRGKTKGLSVHSFYARGGQSLWDMASFFQGAVTDAIGDNVTADRILWGFGKLRDLQIEMGHKPIIVVRICSGLNDRNEANTPSRGDLAYSGSASSALAYGDNLNGLINAIEAAWKAKGWPLDELFFHILTSYPVSNTDDMASYRSGTRMIAQSRERCSFTDLSILVPYADTSANSGLADATHPTNAWTDEMARREVALIPAVEVAA